MENITTNDAQQIYLVPPADSYSIFIRPDGGAGFPSPFAFWDADEENEAWRDL